VRADGGAGARRRIRSRSLRSRPRSASEGAPRAPVSRLPSADGAERDHRGPARARNPRPLYQRGREDTARVEKNKFARAAARRGTGAACALIRRRCAQAQARRAIRPRHSAATASVASTSGAAAARTDAGRHRCARLQAPIWLSCCGLLRGERLVLDGSSATRPGRGMAIGIGGAQLRHPRTLGGRALHGGGGVCCRTAAPSASMTRHGRVLVTRWPGWRPDGNARGAGPGVPTPAPQASPGALAAGDWSELACPS
jgi:hypothetical protein